jgi:hypothetical protein
MSALTLARAMLALYPPAWRARYGDEVRALLEDSGAGPRTIASLAWHAAPAWIWPPGHLHDRPARMRASLTTVLAAWTALAGLAMVFAALAQGQPSLQEDITGPRHLVIEWSYWVFDGAAAASVLAVVVGGLPLWLLLFRRACRDYRPREVAYLLAPVIVPVAYLAATTVAVSILRQPGTGPRPQAALVQPSLIDAANGNVGPWWFLALLILGFAAAGVSAAGPILALRRLRPRGPAVTLAARAAGYAAVTMSLAGVASIVAVLGLYRWAPAYYQPWQPGIYLPAVALAAAVAIVSATRGVRAARSPAA